MSKPNLTSFTDLYQLTMMYGFYQAGKMNDEAVFDLFFRKNPFQNGYTIVAGLEKVIEYIRNLRFTEADIQYLEKTGLFPDPAFIEELRRVRFTGNLYAMPEGTIAFPNEPIIRVETRLFEAQLVETALLTIVGFQSLIATKANRIVRAAEGRPVMEFGSRRAQETEAAVLGARAAIIGGCVATSNVLAGELFNLQIAGTHAHSWVMSFDSELESFRAYAKVYPDNLILLVDTYDTLRSGIPNAIQVFREVFATHGRPKAYGIRIDSGDLAYLSKSARDILDDAGFPDAKIVVSNDLDEYLIRELHMQGAKIDSYGVGTKLITAFDQPAIGCVYKLAAERVNGQWTPRLKRSENPEKITNPGVKKILRFFDRHTQKAVVDLIMLDDEPTPTQPFEVFDPVHTWKRKVVDHAHFELLLAPIFVNGELVYKTPPLTEIVDVVKRSLDAFSEERVRLSNPHTYHVDLSQKLWDTKMHLLNELARL
ncbi:nicotinate phosphoribosyltransferase [Alicyclobacillus tolerans]|uniref:nicotinate phosphoribosyltransferase n=1 Tax=Alicyclobacillus tolerans TaxID=90970 RepID=UPI001F00701C|nr:nicotinate phosphoribosyltransferase [Alicyclobacillus tolerans]MCF8566411.1 nicotinate phosphoribosyltransferase [Alicyclobacillus tolerans]